MIIIIDNYDSFVYNIARYVMLSGEETQVYRNDEITPDECMALKPDGVIISPGPKAPKDAGICMELLKVLPEDIPLLGVCLGHQCLVEHFYGKTVRARRPMHGEASVIDHCGAGIFKNLSSPLSVGRYHSLISVLPNEDTPLKVSALSAEREVMAVHHQTASWFGVQFHPESVLTPAGEKIIDNFVNLCGDNTA